jgi:hypothetical protein
MKDNMFQNMMQEKNDKLPQKCFGPEMRCRPLGSILQHLAIHRFQQRDILRSMSVSARALEPVHAQVRAAIIHRRPIAALYRGRRRLLCPHLLGWNRHRRLQVLCYQYGGDSESGLKPAEPSENWRCLAVQNLSQVELLDDPWQTAENRSRPQTCIEEVELDVDACPELVPPTPSPNPKNAKL